VSSSARTWAFVDRDVLRRGRVVHEPSVKAMLETVELLDPGSPGVDAALLRTLAARRDRGRAIVVGSEFDADRVAAEGFQIAGRLPISIRRTPRMWSASLRRLLHRLGTAGILRTWSEPALVAALGASDAISGLDASVSAVSTRTPLIEPWLRHRVAVRAIGEDLGPRLFRRGWRLGPPRSLGSLPSPLLPSEPPRRARVDPDTLVVAMAGSPLDALDGWLMLGAAASAVVAGRAITVVVSPNHPGCLELGRWACGMVAASASNRLRVVIDPRVEDPRLAAMDVDLAVMPVHRSRTGDVSLVTARAWLAAGVPLVAPLTRGLVGLVDDGVDGRLLPAGDRNALARVLLRVADDPTLLEDMSHAAAARHGARRSSAFGRGSLAQDAGSSAANASAASR
jgi:hypothetical protein